MIPDQGTKAKTSLFIGKGYHLDMEKRLDKDVFGRIRDLDENLQKAGVSSDDRNKIMEGADKILKTMNPKVKAGWLADAMDRMDGILPEDVRFKVREGCACSTGGKRLETMKGIARMNLPLEDAIKEIDKSKIFGYRVELDGNRINVNFGVGQCVCSPKFAGRKVSATYCHCCKGHVLRLMEVALKKMPLTGDVVGSACSGTGPCRFAVHLD